MEYLFAMLRLTLGTCFLCLHFVFTNLMDILWFVCVLFGASAMQNHSCPMRFSSNENLALVFCSKTITQKSIRYIGSKMWNDLLFELKSNSRISFNIFFKNSRNSLIQGINRRVYLLAVIRCLFLFLCV